MGIWDPVSPNTLFSPWLPSTLGLTTKVQIRPDIDNARRWVINWICVPQAVKYIVYASPSPTNRNKFKEVRRGKLTTTLEVPIAIPDDYVIYIWVGAEMPNGTIELLQCEPVMTTNDTAFEQNPLSAGTERDIFYDPDAKYHEEEGRRRLQGILEFDGEDFYLYIKRLFGQPCICLETQSDGSLGRVIPIGTTTYTDLGTEFDPGVPTPQESEEMKDPEYRSPGRCLYCFGTSVAGGYFPRIAAKIRYGNVPRRSFNFQDQGIEIVHTFNSMMLWHPKLKEGDFIVRRRTGERFLVTEVGQSELRGMPRHQEFNAIAIPRTGIQFDVNDSVIQQALDAEGGWDISTWDWGLWR